MILEDERDALTEEEKQYFLEYDEMLAEPAFFTQQPRNNGNVLENTPLCDLIMGIYLWNPRFCV